LRRRLDRPPKLPDFQPGFRRDAGRIDRRDHHGERHPASAVPLWAANCLTRLLRPDTIRGMKSPIRPQVLTMQPYSPGKPIDEVKRELGLERVVKLASN